MTNDQIALREIAIEERCRVRNDFHRAIAAIGALPHSAFRTEVHLAALLDAAGSGLASWHGPDAAAATLRRMADRIEGERHGS